jgi:hypothetical protein
MWRAEAAMAAAGAASVPQCAALPAATSGYSPYLSASACGVYVPLLGT